MGGSAAAVEEYDTDWGDLIQRSLSQAGQAAHRRMGIATLHCVARRRL